MDPYETKKRDNDWIVVPAGILGTIALVNLPHSLPFIAGAAGLYGGYKVIQIGWSGLRSVGKWKPRHVPAIQAGPKPRPIQPPPPPPTAKEVGERARQRYETSLRLLEAADLDAIEMEAARARAKQQYLRELDGLLS